METDVYILHPNDYARSMVVNDIANTYSISHELSYIMKYIDPDACSIFQELRKRLWLSTF